MDLHPQIPSFMIHLLCVGEKLRNSIKSVIKKEQVLLHLSTSIDVMNLRQRRHPVVNKSSLDEFLIELPSVVSDDAVCAFEDLLNPNAEIFVIVYVTRPERIIPGVLAVDLTLSEDLPPEAGDGIN